MANLENQLEYYKQCTNAAELRLDRALKEVHRLEQEVERVKQLHDEQVEYAMSLSKQLETITGVGGW